MATKTIIITTATGSTVKATLEVKASYTAAHRDTMAADGWGMDIAESARMSHSITIEVNGATFMANNTLRHPNFTAIDQMPDNFPAKKSMPKNAAGFLLMYGTDRQQAMLTVADMSISDTIEAAWVELEQAELASNTDAARVIESRDAEERSSKVEAANEIISKIKSTKRYTGELLSDDDLGKWYERYNALYNEGGDGWTPELVSIEQVSWARDVLAATA